MKTPTRIATLAVVAAFGAVPALALGDGTTGPPSTVTTGPPSTVTTGPPSTVTTGPPSTVTTGPLSTTPPSNQGTAHKPSMPGPNASLPDKAKAYGYYCRKEEGGSPDRTRTSGLKGTAFSQCVTAMAELATGKSKSPKAACRSESKKPSSGHGRSPFSLCVAAGKKLLSHNHNG